MLILGLLLLVAAGALTIGLLTGNTHTVKAEVFGYSLKSLSVGELFAIGVGTGIVLIIGLVMVLSGLRRGGRKRKARRQELNAKRARESELQDENARLARELAQQRRSGAAPPPQAMPSAPASGAASGSPPGASRVDPSSSPSSAPASTPPATSSDQDRTTVLGSPTSPAGPPAQGSSDSPEARP